MKLFHFILTILQWIAVVLLVIFFGLTTILIGQFDRKTKKWPARWYRFFCKAVLFVTRVKVVVIGQHHVDRKKNYLVCSNHQGLFDIISHVVAVPLPLLFVSKPDYFRIPIMGQGMRASGHLEVTRRDMKRDRRTMDQLANYLKEGRSYVMYPEGTRSKDESVGPFKMGAFHAATKARIEILPVTVLGSRERMPQGAKSVVPGTVRVIIGEAIEAGALPCEELRDKVRDAIVQQFERYATPLD